MRLFEFEGKEILKRFGIAVPPGRVARSPEQAEEIAVEFGCPVAIKAQVLSGRRGKAGGIRFAENPVEAKAVADALLGSTVGGDRVEAVLVEERLDIARELYCGITVDPSQGLPLLMFCPQGGVDIEELAVQKPELVARRTVPLSLGLEPFMVREAARSVRVCSQLLPALGEVGARLYRVFTSCDAIVAEINPLVVTAAGKVVAADCKLDIDDDALHRHPEFSLEGRIPGETELERRARKLGIKYVEFDGNVGIAGNGAGLMMTTLDLVLKYGGKPANFVEAGGAAARAGSGEGAVQWWRTVVQLVLENPRVDVLLFNLHGGNQRCDEVARGVLEGLRSSRPVKTVIRLSGTREAEGRKLIEKAGYRVFGVLEEAAQAAASLGTIA
ncbi:MAG: succinate--CoA ligase subunit beta [Bacillota bacterium]|nr:succinate--CoA ligase subunit beta [Bacillota bacterium]